MWLGKKTAVWPCLFVNSHVQSGDTGLYVGRFCYTTAFHQTRDEHPSCGHICRTCEAVQLLPRHYRWGRLWQRVSAAGQGRERSRGPRCWQRVPTCMARRWTAETGAVRRSSRSSWAWPLVEQAARGGEAERGGGVGGKELVPGRGVRWHGTWVMWCAMIRRRRGAARPWDEFLRVMLDTRGFTEDLRGG